MPIEPKKLAKTNRAKIGGNRQKYETLLYPDPLDRFKIFYLAMVKVEKVKITVA